MDHLVKAGPEDRELALQCVNRIVTYSHRSADLRRRALELGPPPSPRSWACERGGLRPVRALAELWLVGLLTARCCVVRVPLSAVALPAAARAVGLMC